MRVYLDLETYSTVDLKTSGTFKYAENSEIVLFAVAVDDGPVYVYESPAADPLCDQSSPFGGVLESLYYADEIWAHNAVFDRAILDAHDFECARIYEGPSFTGLGLYKWRDSCALARSLSLPASLGGLCDFFRLGPDDSKDPVGKRLIRLFCMPQKNGRRIMPSEAPEEWKLFTEYARRDVSSMRECIRMMEQPALGAYPRIWDEWHADQRINARGMRVDVELAHRAVAMCTEERRSLADEVTRITCGAVTSTSQCGALKSYLHDHLGTSLPDLRADTVDKALSTRADMPAPARRLLEIRRTESRTSTTKYQTLIDAVCRDGRLRGTMTFCGAERTGRWSGRMFQPQNLPRGTMTPDEVDEAIDAIKCGAAPILYRDVMETASSCLRGAVCADDGCVLVDADLSNIEGRVLAWLAGEEWKLDAFRAFDAGDGPDIYKAAYARAFGCSPDDVTKRQRQIGKIMELALGYGGGVQAFVQFARLYGIDLDDMASRVYETMPRGDIEDAAGDLERSRMTYDISPRACVAVNAIKLAWRRAHPRVVALWDACGTGICGARDDSAHDIGPHITASRVPVMMHDGTARDAVRVVLPSGRALRYYDPVPGKRAGEMSFYDGGHRARVSTHGGKVTENLTQAVARDILAHGIAAAEEAGIDIIFSVHDELVAESPADAPRLYTLVSCMTNAPAWALSLPLSAAGWIRERYKKD